MANIQSRYNCVAGLPDVYTLTGNDRAARLTLAQNTVLSFFVVGNKAGGTAFFNGDTFINIKRMRVRSPKAPGVSAGTSTAGVITLSFCAMLGFTADSELDAARVNVPKWGEWFDSNIKIEPYKTAYAWNDTQLTQHKPVGAVIGYNSYMNVDDYNVQADYIGQDVDAAIDLEIETAGVISSSTYVIF